MRIEGVHVAQIAHFGKNEALDLKRTETHLEWLAAAGVQGFVPCGTTGESPTLSPEERNDLIRLSVHVAKKHGLKVTAGCGGNNTKKVLPLLEEAALLGADAALVVAPYYNKPTQAGLIAHYEYLAGHSPLPIILYNVPGRTGVNLLPETVAKLWSHSQITGIKEASGMHSQWLALAGQLSLKKKALLAGDDDAFATILAMGGSGIISASANVAPHQFVEIWKKAQEKDWEGAFQLQAKIFPLVKALFMESSPAPTKYALSKMGLAENYLRLPLVPVTPTTETAIDAVLKTLEIL